ncbi:shikimate kinase [Candidiatus Paracoxiella cheracis]|uniref:shikimate kinase n=1 Tax=Candidiatus Paracoxiella cheracis TaxID=3405120 RepID=UPI003BF58ABA
MKKNLNNIYLIGPMGSGKTSVGKCLATLSHTNLYDSDEEIEKATGVDIPWIFEQEGEKGFRKREAEMIKKLTHLKNIILSTGGGVIMTESNRRQLAENGVVVYLQVSVDTQLKRTARKKESRPMLRKHNSKEKLNQLNEIRHSLYTEIADLVYNANVLTPMSLAEQILKDIDKLKQNDQ